MSKKIIFFDVDGTLVDVRPVKECIPESTIQAVHETRKKRKFMLPLYRTFSCRNLSLYSRCRI